MINKLFITLCIGFIGGYIGKKTGLPTGALLGSMIFVGTYNMIYKSGYLPLAFSNICQIFVGCVIGLNFTMDNIKVLSNLFLPSLVVLAGLLFISVLLGIILNKLTGIDLVTSLFATCPGGLSYMALITDIYKAESHIVVFFHTLRLVTVVTLMPIIIKLVLKLLQV